MKHRAHPVWVAPSQIIVYGDQVHSTPGEGIQKKRKGGHEGFTFTCAHLGDAPVVQDDATHELDIEMPLVYGSPCGFAHGCESFGQDIVQKFVLLLPQFFIQFEQIVLQSFALNGYLGFLVKVLNSV